jgi:hypothetical protein
MKVTRKNALLCPFLSYKQKVDGKIMLDLPTHQRSFSDKKALPISTLVG